MRERYLAARSPEIDAVSFPGALSTSAGSANTLTWLLVLTAVLLTRFSWTPTFLGTDRVNLAYALEVFDPLHHQPHPPGYPLFVGFARLVNFFTSNVEVTFWTISVIATATAASILYLLAARMVSRWTAVASVILFLLNPIVWFCRLRSPLRPWLAVFSLLVGYCAWRAWNGERRFVFWGALALGVGTGFRPDLLAYLLPIWAVSAWKSAASWKLMSWKLMIQAGAIVVGMAALWVAIVASAMGGIEATTHVIWAYLTMQSRTESLVFAESLRLWLRPMSRLIIWNSMAVIGWVWAPIVFHRRIATIRSSWVFLSIWLVPGLTFQLLVHIGEPGHTLFATPVLCLLGASIVFSIGRYRDAILAVAAFINAALFLNALPLEYPPSPQSSAVEKAFVSLRNSIAYGTFETSLERLRWNEEIRAVSVDELWRFRLPGHPTMIVALNGNENEFEFINWRVVSYYMSDPLWVLMDNTRTNDPGRIRLVQGKDIAVSSSSTIALPHSGRVLWIMKPGGRFHRALEKYIPVRSGRYILYSDIPSGMASFEIEGFRFRAETETTPALKAANIR
jgi:hypothetical protein